MYYKSLETTKWGYVTFIQTELMFNILYNETYIL